MTLNVDHQAHLRLSPQMLATIEARAKTAGQRRAVYVRDVVLRALANGLPAMSLKADGGTETQGATLCVRLRTSDFKRLEAASRKAGVTTSKFLRAALMRVGR